MRLSGRFGRFGGCFVPEILVPALEQLEGAFLDAQEDAAFARELEGLLANYAGRPTPLTQCRNLPANLYLKREDLLNGGALKINRVIGREARDQMIQQVGRPPDVAVACVGGGSNAIGLFADFLDDDVRLIGVEAAGRGLDGGEHGATLQRGAIGILHGAETYVLQDQDGQISESWSVSAGLDYPAVGPEHAFLKDSGRAQYVGATDQEALDAFAALARSEGIVCAFESAHAVAHALKLAGEGGADVILVGLSGRGDKDMEQAQRLLALPE